MNREDSKKASKDKKSSNQGSQKKISANKEQNVSFFLLSSKNLKYTYTYMQL